MLCEIKLRKIDAWTLLCNLGKFLSYACEVKIDLVLVCQHYL